MDINNFIDQKLVDSLTKINEQLVKAGTNIDNLIPSIKKLEEAQSELGKNTKENNNERKQLTANEKEAAKITKQLEATEAKLLSLQKGQQDALIKTRTQLQQNTKATKDLQRAQSAQRGSTEQLSAVNVILEKRLRSVNQTTAEGKKKADLLRSAIDKNNKKITEQSSAFVKTKRGIGGYSAGVQDAIQQSGLLSREMTIINKVTLVYTSLVKKQSEAQAAATAATTFTSKALNVLKVALISTGVGALVVALGSLVAFFKSSEEGAASLQRILSPFKILFGNLKDLAIKLGGSLADAFENPQEAVKGLWDAIKQNLINRVQGIIDTFKFLGKTIQASLDLDWDAVKENAAKAGESVIQSMTGVDDAIGKAVNGVKNFAEETKKENEQNKELVNERLALIKREREASIELANLEVEIQNNRLKLKDEENLTEQERLMFAERAQEQINAQAKIQEELAAKRLEFRKLENSFSTSSQEDLDEETRLQVELINVQAANAKKLLRIESEKQTILKRISSERIAANKLMGEELVAIKLETDNKEIELEVDKLEQLNEVRAESAAKESEDLAKSDELKGESTNKELALIQSAFNFRSAKLDADLAAAEGNEKKQNEIRTKQAKQEKGQALFSTAINTAQGITKAISMFGPPPSPLGIAGIAFAGAIGLAQSLAIASKPIPQFAKGTNYSPSGLAELAERGRELVQNPNGEVWMAENRGLYNLQQGSKVLTNQKTEAILNDGRMVGGLARIEKAIKRQPRQSNGSRFDARQKGFREGYLASKHRLN